MSKEDATQLNQACYESILLFRKATSLYQERQMNSKTGKTPSKKRRKELKELYQQYQIPRRENIGRPKNKGDNRIPE